MNVEIGTEAAQFPEKEYINGIFVAVYLKLLAHRLELRLHGFFFIHRPLFGPRIGQTALFAVFGIRSNVGRASAC
jgi:hypothetical protein